MLRLVKEGEFSSDNISIPPITVEEGTRVYSEMVAQLYIQTQAALNVMFGTPLNTTAISEIYVSSDYKQDPEERELLGEFNSQKRVILYPNRIRQGIHRTWKEILEHEFGHAYHAQLCASFPMVDVSSEAFAETIVPIVNANGDIGCATKRLADRMNHSTRLLFGPTNSVDAYPSLSDKKKDSAQILYVMNNFGLEVAVRLTNIPALETTKAVRALLSERVPPLSTSWNKGRARLIDTDFLTTLGLTRCELYYGARQWYSQSE